MTTEHNGDSDPFADPHQDQDHQHQFVADATLNVGRNASLTLGTDSLIVLGWCLSAGPAMDCTDVDHSDEGLREASRIHCCGLIPSSTPVICPLHSR